MVLIRWLNKGNLWMSLGRDRLKYEVPESVHLVVIGSKSPKRKKAEKIFMSTFYTTGSSGTQVSCSCGGEIGI